MIKFFEKAPYSPVEYCYDVEEILYKGKSKFQEIMVIRNQHMGKNVDTRRCCSTNRKRRIFLS